MVVAPLSVRIAGPAWLMILPPARFSMRAVNDDPAVLENTPSALTPRASIVPLLRRTPALPCMNTVLLAVPPASPPVVSSVPVLVMVANWPAEKIARAPAPAVVMVPLLVKVLLSPVCTKRPCDCGPWVVIVPVLISVLLLCCVRPVMARPREVPFCVVIVPLLISVLPLLLAAIALLPAPEVVITPDAALVKTLPSPLPKMPVPPPLMLSVPLLVAALPETRPIAVAPAPGVMPAPCSTFTVTFELPAAACTPVGEGFGAAVEQVTVCPLAGARLSQAANADEADNRQPPPKAVHDRIAASREETMPLLHRRREAEPPASRHLLPPPRSQLPLIHSAQA